MTEGYLSMYLVLKYLLRHNGLVSAPYLVRDFGMECRAAPELLRTAVSC